MIIMKTVFIRKYYIDMPKVGSKITFIAVPANVSNFDPNVHYRNATLTMEGTDVYLKWLPCDEAAAQRSALLCLSPSSLR